MSGMRLELTWPHKDEFLLVPKDEDGKPVWVERSHPAAHEVRLTREAGAVGTFDGTDPHLDNTIFVGDSLDAMRVMCEVPEYAERYRGKVKLIYRDFPLDQTATQAAQLAECAGNDKYFAVLDMMFRGQGVWATAKDPIAELAKSLRIAGMGEAEVKACLANDQVATGVINDYRGGETLGVNSTPTIFINGEQFKGARSLEEFDALFTKLSK